MRILDSTIRELTSTEKERISDCYQNMSKERIRRPIN